MKIVFLDALTLGDVDFGVFEKFGDVKIYKTTSENEILKRVKNADIVVSNKVVIDREIMDNSNIKFIQIAATGMNNVDLKYALSKGITVKNVAGYSTKSVIQHTFALVLVLLNKICYFDGYVRNEYPNSPVFTHIQNWFEIAGKKWGIIGLGEIGSGVADIAKSFGAEVIYYSTSGKNNNSKYKKTELDELLLTSDIISIHAPLNSNTENLLNFEKLSLIKENAVLVNLGRGGIINEKDLAEVLKNKNFYAGLDVFEKEPVDKDSPLLEVGDKIIFTPHVAWTSREARNKLINAIYKNIEEFINKTAD